VKKWLLRGILAVVAIYVALVGFVTLAMLQPPERVGPTLKRLPMPLVWGILPGPRIWLWARQGKLAEGVVAPDFSLAKHDGTGQVTLSSHRGERPVVLVFGSYT
jgi:hypothetical protein